MLHEQHDLRLAIEIDLKIFVHIDKPTSISSIMLTMTTTKMPSTPKCKRPPHPTLLDLWLLWLLTCANLQYTK